MTPLPREVYAADAPLVAVSLLNKVLVAGPCAGRIVEVEAYTRDDPASHSFRGRTARNAVMFGPPGHLYVYLIYGMHCCANVVTGDEGDGQAVLLRAVTPLAGVELMAQRRGVAPTARRGIADGPGKLCDALAIDRSLDGADLCDPRGPLSIVDDGVPPPTEPLVGPRVGITKAAEVAWRFRVPPAQPSQCSQ